MLKIDIRKSIHKKHYQAGSLKHDLFVEPEYRNTSEFNNIKPQSFLF